MRASTGLLIVVTCLLIGVALMASCVFGGAIGSGRAVTETRAVSGFDSVEFSFFGDMTITQGDEESLTISGDDNIVPLIKTEVEDGVLKIYADGVNISRPVMPLRFELKVKDLSGLQLAGAGSITTEKLSTARLAASVTGAGALRIDDLTADALDVKLTGVGDTNVTGTVDRQQVLVSGAGSYFGEDLRSGVAQVTISGLGSARLWATEALDVSISGAGSVEYKGNPQVTQLISGLGTVTAMGE